MFYDHKNDLKGHLIEKLQDAVEIGVAAGVVNIQMDALSEQVQRMVKNKSVSTCDETGARRWERLLSAFSSLSSTLQTRRDTFKAKLMTKPPINVDILQGMVEAYMGLGVDVSVQDFVTKIRYRGEGRVIGLNLLYAMAHRAIPANFLLDIVYLYVTWNELDVRSITSEQLDTENLTLK